MYIINTPISFEFPLPPSGSPPAQSEYDIAVFTPAGVRTYTDNVLTTYNAPTATSEGYATYTHTPNALGRWRYTISTGVEGNYVEHSAIEIYVVNPYSVTSKTVINRYAIDISAAGI